jgi:Secretion system C-terminal sorting domain
MNSANTINSYIDREAAGVSYYRLKQAGQNGNFKYSNVVILQNKAIGTRQSISVYPNPVKDILNVEPGIANKAKMNMTVVDTYGKIVIHKVIEQTDNESTNHLQLSTSDLPAGVYILKITSGSETKTTRFVKQR